MTPENKRTVKRLDFIRGLLILTLVLYIVVALIMNSSYLTLDRMMRLRDDVIFALTEDRVSTVALEGEDTVDVQLFQDGFVVLTRNGITVRGNGGNVYSAHVRRYKDPRLKVSGNYILCFDRGGTEWCLLNSFRILCSRNEEGDIINGSVSDDGYVSIASERKNAKGCVTVYNTEGLDLVRWEDTRNYLLDSFFLGKNRLAVVSLASNREKTDTVFTVFNYKSGEVLASVASPDTFPLAMKGKENGTVELLTHSGVISFDGERAALLCTYSQPSPDVFRQSSDGTVISYHTLSGTVLVEALSAEGKTLFTAEYPNVLSVDCYADRYFVLTTTELSVLDERGTVLYSRPATASRILASEEIVLLWGDSSAEVLELPLPS